MPDLLTQAKSSSQLVSELKEQAQKSLYFLSKAILGFDALTPHLHQEVAKEIQDIDNNPFLLIELPRKHFKSTIGTIGFPIWIHIQDFIPKFNMKGVDVRILIGNETSTNSEHFLSIIETLWDTNELLRLCFPHLIIDPSKRKRWNSQEMLLNRKATWPEACIETIGVGGAAQSRHYEIQILDDMIGQAARDSQTVMDGTIKWYDYSESLSVSPTRFVCRVYGTRWGKRDIYQHIRDKDGKKFKIYSRECRENGKPIFPEWYTNEYFDDLMEKNLEHYLSQYCNNPMDPAKCDLKPEWIKYYSFERTDGKLLIKLDDKDKPFDFRELDIVGAFDPSIDEKPTASKRAITYWGSDSRSNCLLLDSYSSRDSTDKVLDQLFIMYKKWAPRSFLVEAVALSKVFIPLIEREAKVRKMEGKPYIWVSCTPVRVSTQKSKDARIRETIQSVAAEGRLYIQKHHREFIEEFVNFPGGKTKDILDASTHCLSALRTPDTMEEIDEYMREEEDFLRKRSAVTGY